MWGMSFNGGGGEEPPFELFTAFRSSSESKKNESPLIDNLQMLLLNKTIIYLNCVTWHHLHYFHSWSMVSSVLVVLSIGLGLNSLCWFGVSVESLHY